MAEYYDAKLQILKPDQCKKMLDAAMEILEDVGCEVINAKALSIFKKAGVRVVGQRVYLTRPLIDKAFSSVPKFIPIYNREGKLAMQVGGDNVYYGPGLGNAYFIDPFTGERNLTVQKNIAQTATVCDYLPNIDFVMSLGLLCDCPAEYSDLYETAIMLANTKKPIVLWTFTADNYRAMLEMAASLVGGMDELCRKPFVFPLINNIPPLIHPEESLNKMMLAAEYGLPYIYSSGGTLGVSGPITMAGTLAIGLADCLLALVLGQLINEGSPFIAGNSCCPIDMKTMVFSYGAPENALSQAVSADLCHYMRLPYWSLGGYSDSKAEDEQMAVESTLSLAIASMANANLIHDIGFLDSAMTGSLISLMMADEIISMIKRIKRGVEVNTETLQIDLIKALGPGGGYLSSKQTIRHWREELWLPRWIDRSTFSSWQNKGERTFKNKLVGELRQILDSHSSGQVTPEQEAKLWQIVEKSCK